MKKGLTILCALGSTATMLMTGCQSTGAGATGESTAMGTGEEARPHIVVTLNQPTQAAVETADQGTIALHKEEMVVGKREVSNGGVLLRTVVKTENVSQPVELTREEYVIERIPASQAAAYATNSAYVFKGQEIYVPLMREEAVAGKRTLITEQVHLSKTIQTDTATVTHPVRTESVEIVKTAGSPPAGPASIGAGPIPDTTTELNADSVTLAREDLVVGKRQVDNGGVRLRKVITTEEASQPVQLTREEYTITRTPVAEQTAQEANFAPREIKMDLSREEAVAGTQTHLTEVVRVQKQIHTDNQVVSGTLRKESFEVIRTPGTEETASTAIKAAKAPASTESQAGEVALEEQ